MRGNEAGAQRLPSVVFIGPLKTGTTWIHDYLVELDSVILPKGAKETFFFDRHHGEGLSFYEAFFSQDDRQGSKVRVEVAPSYGGRDDSVLERMAVALDDVTVVITLRDPVERTISQYRHEVRYGYYRGPLSKHLTKNDPIVQRSDYPRLLASATRIFGVRNVKVLDFAELREDPYRFCARVCSCLGLPYVPPSDRLLSAVSNEGQVPRFPRMVRGTTVLVDLLKRHGMYSASQLARRMGLRRLLERPVRTEERSVSGHERDAILALLDFDYGVFLKSVADLVPAPAEGFQDR